MKRRDEPIITSLLDTDFYVFTMLQLVWQKHRNVKVKSAFMNRTKTRLADAIDMSELRENLDHLRQLTLTESELRYLRGTTKNDAGERMFCEEFLQDLRKPYLCDFDLYKRDGQIDLTFEGPWFNVLGWETCPLSIANELYYRSVMEKADLSALDRECIEASGRLNLAAKIRAFKSRPDIESIVDFGTRRRFSKQWQQDVVVPALVEGLGGQFKGTSDVEAAMKHGIMPVGTYSHSLPMVCAAISDGTDEDLIASQRRVLEDWWELYGEGLSVFLPDAFGTKSFLDKVMTKEISEKWRGCRIDSMNPPISAADCLVWFWERHGIDPKQKLLVPSDGLETASVLDFQDRHRNRTRTSYGIGTFFTNDMGDPRLASAGIHPISIVLKNVEANGRPCVKLSDNPAKAMGPKDEVERYMRVFGHDIGALERVECHS